MFVDCQRIANYVDLVDFSRTLKKKVRFIFIGSDSAIFLDVGSEVWGFSFIKAS